MRRKVKITRKDKFIIQDDVFHLFNEFINDSYAGRRVKKNGQRISSNTVVQYEYLQKNLLEFLDHSGFEFKIYISNNLTQTEKERANRYYRKFYKQFTNHLYDRKKFFDNYTGLMIKTLRIFFNYLENERNISVGAYHKSFFIPREEIPIIALSHDQLNYFIYNQDFHNRAKEEQLEVVKDIFVFGCTVALRVSDLLKLSHKNLLVKEGKYYLQVKSQKTSTYTSIKLPDYAVDILLKYKKNKRNRLMPDITKAWFNTRLKHLGQLLPDNFEIVKTREKRGKQIVVYKDPEKKIHYKLADHMTTHTMRRTAITTMLGLGMPEHIVRKISGHAANSREFYRYVQLSQTLIDEETDKVFELLKARNNQG